MPTRSFGLVDYKVREAEYFLVHLSDVARDLNFAAVQFTASAFASAARSVTFAMQSSLADHPSFDSWYSPRQKQLKSDPLARFFHEFRRVTQHIGDSVVSGGRVSGARATYYFRPTVDIPQVPSLDVETACTEYFRTILRLVYDCYVELAPTVNAQWRFTREHFAALGKTIEDAEEEFGLPRGWTGVGGVLDEPKRWFLLRREADGCGLNSQFDAWLGVRIPHPDDDTVGGQAAR